MIKHNPVWGPARGRDDRPVSPRPVPPHPPRSRARARDDSGTVEMDGLAAAIPNSPVRRPVNHLYIDALTKIVRQGHRHCLAPRFE
jgi:hypothetical protein